MKKAMVLLIGLCSLCLGFGIFYDYSIKDSEKDSMTERSVFAMDTYMNLRVYGKNTEETISLACDRIKELEDLLSVTKEGSDIWQINHADGETVSVSEDTINILNTAVLVGEETQGTLDITLYPVLKEWGFTTQEYQIPKQERLQELLTYVDYRRINIQGTQVSVPKETELDCGALAKGYTSDQILKILKENNIKSALINLGGNIHMLGTKPDGSLWKIGIRNPFEDSGEMCILSASDCAVITSGNYERYFIGEDGKQYCHILDASNGYPADNGLVSVTIIGESGIFCDAFSTAFFAAGMEEAVAYWRKKQNFEMVLVTTEKKIYITEGIKDNIRNVSEMTVDIINK